MSKIDNFITHSYLGGFFMIIVGLIYGYITLKNLNNDDTYPPTKSSHLFIAIGSLLLGILIIIFKIFGKI